MTAEFLAKKRIYSGEWGRVSGDRGLILYGRVFASGAVYGTAVQWPQ